MKLTEEMITLISQTAATAAVEQIERQRKKDKKKDKRFQNTQLLLKNYRGLVAHCEKIKDELIEIDNKSIQDLDIEEISLESIESIKRSRSKTVAMVLFIQSKVKAYKDLCGENDQVKYRILEKKYLSQNKMTSAQIYESENIERATYYKYLNAALDEMRVLFFGIEALEIQ
ncbi:hypothetical protein [Bacillus safensis]|uniref:ArpU family transcriptional regulator n=1 Tax=Bacillus safensis TaxID=561879 RepID=A0A1L6ZD72_BACIA|nr:hypothetical protein [Bacillus safensis]APT44462.1 hypothetical protein BSA145_00085 [Bacillus safensis]